jgi:iron(III) transport system permease protein
VGAVSILFLFGFNGLVTGSCSAQDFNIYGRWGVVASQIFTFAPLAYLSLRGVLPRSARAGGRRLQRRRQPLADLLEGHLPAVAARHLLSAFLVVFIESISDFGNPLVLAGAAFPMLAPQAYLEITGTFNLAARRDARRRAAAPLAHRLRHPALLGRQAPVRDRHRQAERVDLEDRLAER